MGSFTEKCLEVSGLLGRFVKRDLPLNSQRTVKPKQQATSKAQQSFSLGTPEAIRVFRYQEEERSAWEGLRVRRRKGANRLGI